MTHGRENRNGNEEGCKEAREEDRKEKVSGILAG
jgi:hypothetical protein